MQTNHFLFKKSSWLLIVLTITTVLMMAISSCGKGGKKSKNPTCVKLTKEQFQKWVKKGYTDPASKDYMTAIRFTTAYAGPGAVYRVYAIGQRKDYTLINESLTELSALDTCNKKHIELSDFIYTGTIPVDLNDLKILKPGGKLNDSLQYISLRPYDWFDTKIKYNFIAYDFSVIMTGDVIVKPLMAEKGIGLPCPPCPNCPVGGCPKPPTCEICGPSSTDTIPNSP